jgi:hypothetical protein
METTTEKKAPRTHEEIKARFEYMKTIDLLNWATDDLRVYLPEEFAAGYASEALPSPTTEEMLEKIRKYLPFAFDKAANHRGLSAERSVHHLANWAWLAGRDDLCAFALDEVNYPYYGIPILKKFAAELGVEVPPAIAAWQDGGPCSIYQCMDCGAP